jgi:uncharacterized membrane protein
MLILEYTVPMILLLIAISLAAAAGIYTAWRYLQPTLPSAALTAVYGLVLALMFWCLLQPGCRDASRQLIRPRFIVALDTSQSMTVRPNEKVETRFDRALRALRLPWTDAVAAESEIELMPFDTEVGAKRAVTEAPALTAEGTATRLRDALREIASRYTGLNVSGLLLLSDGRDTREAFDDWASDPYPFPIFTVMLEDDAQWVQEPDLRVDTVVSPRRVTSGWDTELKAVVSGQGTQGQPATVQLFRDDVQIAEQPVLIPASGGQREVTFALQHPDVGVFQYRVYVPPLPGETQTADNEYKLSIAVQDPRNRLLYVEGVPRFEYRFLRRVLMASEQLSPAIFYSAADGTPRAGSPAGEATADMSESDLLQFKVVILGNLSATELTERRAENLVKFVEAGGSLVLLGGTRGWGSDGFARTSLRTVVPVRAHGTRPLEGEKPFAVELSETARVHPAFAGEARFWEVIPPVLTVFPDADPKPGAEVLVYVETPKGRLPLVVTQRYGHGRVAAIFTDSLWRWQLAPETQQHPYARFWSQLLSWMLPEADDADKRRLDLFADQDQLHIGEPIELSARFPNPEFQPPGLPEVRISIPDGRVVPYQMSAQQVMTPGGRSFAGFAFRFDPEVPGFYTAEAVHGAGPDRIVSDPISFNVRAFSPETAPRPVREDILRTLARTSGGRHFESIEALSRALQNLQVSVLEEERVEFFSLWRRWPVLLLLMGLTVGMWLLRKWQNLP